ncbi:tripartite motif-containing protein 3-like [Lingula anatina]|uniref:Tripartite motif-containing protein 3-like n=1 Tax=Lingula anatina TaxID=7574 RepID=A0A1S3HSK8_LINAN|nr:tripartite motif-containing protein 3-like [Lingula anatina]|eukprot:XP_013389022.1 tripartite motif-containing protein 3-like [Lingula anatina]
MAESLVAAFTDNLLTCSICLGEYEDPRVLPCYHTFCYGCVCDHATRTMTPNRTFLCPICRQEISFPREGLVKLKKDFRIHKAKELLSQQRKHEVSSPIKESDVHGVNHGNLQLMIKCEKHPTNELKYYCEDDDSTVCGDCALIEHYRHGIVPVKEAANTNRKKIKTVLVKTLPKLNMFKEAVAKETATELEESQTMAASINKIQEQAQCIRRSVDQREQELISEVNSAGDIRKKQRKANMDNLELHHTSLQSACNFAQELITNGSDSEIMLHTKALTQRLTAMEKTPVPTPDTPAQISYSPGEISAAGLEAMLGQVTVQLQPSTPTGLGANLPIRRSTPHPPVFLEKAECVHSFSSNLKFDEKGMFTRGLAIDELHVFIVHNNRTKVFMYEGQFKFEINLNQPFDVAVSQTGNLYITSEGDKCVKVYSTRGQHLTTMGQGQLEWPRGISLNKQGHVTDVMVCDKVKKSIYVFHADSGHENSRIVALSPQGQFIRYIVTRDDGLSHPAALAINPAGQLVVAEGFGKVKTFQYLQ